MPNEHTASRGVGLLDIARSLGGLSIKAVKLADHLLGGLTACLIPSRPETEIPPDQCRQILIIRPGGIGDAVFLIPILLALKNVPTISAVDILCENRNREIFLSQSRLFRKLYCYDARSEFTKIFKNHYDLIVDTEQWHYLSAIVSVLVPNRFNCGFASRPLRAKLFHRRVPYETGDYEMKNFRRLFEFLLGKDTPEPLVDGCFEIEEQTRQWARQMVPTGAVAVFVGASIALRRIPGDLAEAIGRLVLKLQHPVVLLGGKDVLDAGKKFQQDLQDSRVVNLVGQISLAQSTAIIRECRLFIGPDSGLLHLASAVGTPAIGLFGPGNLKKWAPRNEKTRIVTKNVSCSPCTHFGYTVPTCGGTYHCVKDISINDIADFITQELSAS
ncbi:MAG: glycosyltransferase family 9 protein [Candidatus Omnitrophota bacterium]|nr:glycosyltransferase family 9 protein [Candidatus Omnitrophota bacterium]MDZ4241563.1 glycosyltransferase family 9 protein [Candidatus Omnitrophota bacterium]